MARCTDMYTSSPQLLRERDNLLPKLLQHWCCLLVGLFMLCTVTTASCGAQPLDTMACTAYEEAASRLLDNVAVQGC